MTVVCTVFPCTCCFLLVLLKLSFSLSFFFLMLKNKASHCNINTQSEIFPNVSIIILLSYSQQGIYTSTQEQHTVHDFSLPLFNTVNRASMTNIHPTKLNLCQFVHQFQIKGYIYILKPCV